MSYEPSSYWSSGGGGDVTYMQDVANRVSIIYQNAPWLADQSDVVRQLAMSNISTFELARNASALATSVSADGMARSLAQMSKDNQRLVWANLSDAQRAGLASIGYQAPGSDKRSSGFAGWTGAGALLGDVLDTGVKAAGMGARVVNTTLNAPGIKQGMNALIRIGDQPAHLYRTIRMQDGGAQGAGLVGGILGLAGAAFALPTGGASLALTGLALGGGALLGASAASAIVARGEWVQAWNSSWDGERVYTLAAQRQAREMLGDDALLAVAKEVGFEGDLGALATDLAGVRDSTNPNVLMRSLQRYADRIAAPGTPEREELFTALSKVVENPQFMAAVRVLQDGKISFGRDVARFVGLDPGDSMYRLVSGALDAAFVITLDPLLAAGSAFQFARARRFGVATKGVDDLAGAIRLKADNVPAVGRALDEVAAAIDAEDYGRLYRNVNAFKDAWIPTLARARELKQAGKTGFGRDDLIDFISQGKGLEMMLSGGGVRSGYDQILLPRFGYSVMGKVVTPQRATNWAKAVIDISDSNNSVATMRHRLGEEAEAFARMASPAEVRSRPGYGLVTLAEASDAYARTRATLDVVDKIPVVNTAVRKMGALTGAMTSRLPMHGAVRLSGVGTADDVWRMVEMGRIVGMDDLQRSVWRNTIMNAPSEAARMDVVTSFVDAMLTTAGVRYNKVGSDMVDEFLLRVRQTYSNGEIGRRMTDGAVRRRGVLSTDRAVELPIPDFKELRKAAQKGTLLPMLNRVTDSRLVEGVMNVWKPAVLLRIAFIPRNGGEEILGFLARNGVSAYFRQWGYRSVAEGQVYDEVAAMGEAIAKQWIDSGLMTAEEAASELKRLGRLQYAAHVRPLERILSTNRWTDPEIRSLGFGPAFRALGGPTAPIRGALGETLANYTAAQRRLLREGMVPNLVDRIPEKWQVALAGRPESLRRMVLAGAEPQRVAASRKFVQMNGGAVARELSAHEANLLGPTSRFEQSFDVPVTDRKTGKTTMQSATVHHGSFHAYGPDDRATPRMASFAASRIADDPLHAEAVQHVVWHSPPLSMRGGDKEALLNTVDRVAERSGNDIVGLLLSDLLDPSKAIWSPTLAKVAQRGELGMDAARQLVKMDPAEFVKWIRKNRKALGYTPGEVTDIENLLNGVGALNAQERGFVAGRAQYAATFGPNARMAPRTLDDDLVARVTETGNAYYDFERAVDANGIHPDAPWYENPMVTDARQGVDAAYIFGDGDEIARAEAHLRDMEAITADEVATIRRDWTEARREDLMAEALAASNDHATLATNKRPLEQLQARIAELDESIATAATEKDRILAQWQKERLQGQMDRWYPETIDPARFPSMPPIVTEGKVRGPGWRPDGWLWDRQAQDKAVEAGVMDTLNRVGFQHVQSGMEWNQTMADGTRVVNSLTEAGTRTYVPMLSTPAAEELVSRLAAQGARAVRDELREHLRTFIGRLSPDDATRMAGLGEDRISDFVDMIAVRGADGWAQIITDLASADGLGSLPLAVMAFDDAATARLLSRATEDYLVGSADLIDNLIGVGQINGPRELAKLAPVDLDGFSRPLMSARGGATWDLEPTQMARQVDAVSGGIVTLPNGQTAMGATLEQAQREHAQMFVAHLNASLRPGDTRLLTVATPGYFSDSAATIPLEVGTQLSPASRVYDERGLPVPVQAAAAPTGAASLPETEIAWQGWYPILRDEMDVFAGTQRFVTDHDVFDATDAATQHLLGTPSKRAFRAHWSDWQDGPIPAQVIGPALLPPDRKGLIAKIGEFGFGKVIAPALEAVIRTPLAAHSFIEAMVENRRFVKWLKNPTVWGEMDAWSSQVTAAARLDVADAVLARDLRKVLPTIDPAATAALDGLDDAGLVRYAGDYFGGEGGAARIERLAKKGDAASKRVAEHPWWATDLRGADDLPEAVVNLYRELLGDALSRPYEAARRAIDRLPDAMKAPLDGDGWRLLTAADRNLAGIDDVLSVTAQQRAITNGLNWVDSHEMRSQFGEAMKAWSPFWYAEENFLRRWAKTLKMNPAAIRQAQLLYGGLKSGGLIQTDAQGREWYVYPGSGLAAEVFGKLTPLPAITGDVGVLFRAEPSAMLPGFNVDQTGIPQAGPLAGVTLQFVTQMFPELNDFRATLVGEAAVNQSALMAFVPPTYRRLWETFTKDEDTSRKYASAMMSMAAIMDAKGLIPDEMTTEQRDDMMRTLRDGARTVLATQAVLGFIVPGSPQAEFTAESNTSLSHLLGIDVDSIPNQLRDEYLSLVYELGPEEGLIRYLARYPEQNLWGIVKPEAFTVSQSTSPSGAPIPATVEAGQWAERNIALLERYPEGAAWLFPPNRDGSSNFDQYTYTQQVISDLRRQRTPKEFLNALKFKEGATEYFAARDDYEKHRRALDERGNDDGKRVLDAEWQIWSTEFKTVHPVFTEVLESGDSKRRRDEALRELRIALSDPDVPDEPHVAKVRELVDSYDAFRYQLQQITLSRSAASQRQGAALKQAFSVWVSDFVYQNRQLQSMWLTLLKPDVDLG